MYKDQPFENSKHSYRIQEVDQWAPFQCVTPYSCGSLLFFAQFQNWVVGQRMAKS
jgi:hypothetical protein